MTEEDKKSYCPCGKCLECHETIYSVKGELEGYIFKVANDHPAIFIASFLEEPLADFIDAVAGLAEVSPSGNPDEFIDKIFNDIAVRTKQLLSGVALNEQMKEEAEKIMSLINDLDLDSEEQE